MPQKTIDDMAHDKKMQTAMTHTQTSVFMKTVFKKGKIKHYNAFDATERIEAIEEFLGKEIDFHYFQASGVIE